MQTNRKEELKAVFNDTMLQIQVNDKLTQATRSSVKNTRHYAPDEYPVINHDERSQTKIAVTRSTTFDAARKLHKTHPDKRIAVLNFASATNPGGGVTRGVRSGRSPVPLFDIISNA